MALSTAMLLVHVNYHIHSIVQPSNLSGTNQLFDAKSVLKTLQSGMPLPVPANLAHLNFQSSTIQPLPVVLSSVTIVQLGILTFFNAYH